MKYALPFFLLLTIILNFRCTTSNIKIDENRIRAVRIRDNAMSIFDSAFERLKEGRVIYFYKNYRVIETEGLKTVTDHRSDTATTFFIENPFTHSYLCKKYFIMKRGNEKALLYDTSVSEKLRYQIKNSDSVMQKWGRIAIKMNPGACMKLAYTKKQNGVLMLAYEMCNRKETYYSDSVYYFLSNKMKDIDFSMDEYVDSLQKMKLFRSQVVYHTMYSTLPKDSIYLPRVVDQHMEEIKVKNPGFIISLCKMYEDKMKSSP